MSCTNKAPAPLQTLLNAGKVLAPGNPENEKSGFPETGLFNCGDTFASYSIAFGMHLKVDLRLISNRDFAYSLTHSQWNFIDTEWALNSFPKYFA